MMADFFTRLAERTLGLDAGVRPDTPPVLAPAGDSGTFDDRTTAAPAAQAARLKEPAASVTPMITEPIPRQHGNGARLSDDNPMRRSPLPRDTQDRPSESPHAVVAAPTPAQRRSRDASAEFLTARQEYTETPVPLDSNDEVMAPTQPRALAAAVTLPSAAAHWRPSALQQPPTVQVTIGRVEVRAVTAPPSAAPQRPLERRMAARLSLDEYLRQRNEGRR